jgi:hypothetical protein
VTSALLAEPVERAIHQLETDYADVGWELDGEGGVYVDVGPIAIGARWTPEAISVSCQVAFNYPDSPIYPFYTTTALESTVGLWPSALQRVNWRGRDVVQISLRTRHWRPEHDTASTAIAMVGHWFRTVQ